MSLTAGTQIGKYILRRKLAEGGMAEIYLASVQGPQGFEKEVVIKRVRPLLAEDETFVQMFVDEARLASKLSHANVVQIFDFDKHEDTYYLAMEYVRGQSLWSVRRRAKDWMRPMSPVMVAQVGLEIARGLHYAHRLTDRGEPLALVHRDVTPHNVLLSYEGAIKLTDFGIAKAGNRLTSAGVLKGKFAYMSPEQARGDPLDARTDVFALGIVLWELLTGSRLFDGDSDIAVLRAVQERAIPPPARLNPEVPAGLDAAVMRALERDLSNRFGSAQELERALAQFLFDSVRKIDDTNVGSYLRQLFPDESAENHDVGLAPPAPTVLLKPLSEPSSPSPGQVSPSPSRAPAAESSMALDCLTEALSPDEDAHQSTLVLEPVAALPMPTPQPPPPPRRGLRVAIAVGVLALAAVGTGWLLRNLAAVEKVESSPAIEEPALAEGPAAVEKPAIEVPPNGVTTAEADPTPAGEYGNLVLRVKPWANIQVDGHPRKDVQGTRILRLAVGEHTVKLVHRNQTETFRVAIRARKETSINFSFKP